MRFKPAHSSLAGKSLSLLGVLLVLTLGLVPGSQRVCLASGQVGCCCCVEAVDAPHACCSDLPAAPAQTPRQDEAPCCVDLQASPSLWLAVAPSFVGLPAPAVSMLLPDDAFQAGQYLMPAAPPARPPMAVPAHIRFCCPRA